MQERTAGTSAGRGVISVAELTQRLKTAIEERFGSVRVEGEMLSVRRVSSGHLYFTLKDQGAQLPAVMWRSTASRCPVALRDGLRVVASGDVQVYPPHGRYQLVVHRVVEAGVGALLAELEALKARLHAEGLFDPHRKRPLPLLPRRVGVVTAATGAALRDIVRAVLARYPARILLAPAKVQGEGAAASIVSALEGLGRHAEVDVIVVGRGGGSVEDLWAFNEEAVVRAVAACPTPVVCASRSSTRSVSGSTCSSTPIAPPAPTPSPGTPPVGPRAATPTGCSPKVSARPAAWSWCASYGTWERPPGRSLT